MYNIIIALVYLHLRSYHYIHLIIIKTIGIMMKIIINQISIIAKPQMNTTKREKVLPAPPPRPLPFPVMYRITCGNASRGISLSLQPRQQPQRQQRHVATVTAEAATALEAGELLHKEQAQPSAGAHNGESSASLRKQDIICRRA